MARRTKLTLGLAGALSAALGALSPQPARAQSADDKTAADALYDEGKRLLGENKFAEACARFESSQRLDPGVGTLLFLADCYEKAGRVASAWSTFREAASAAKAAGQPDRETVARQRAAVLGEKLFMLTLTVGGAATPGLQVMRNETAVKREVWDVGVPVDPGSYKLSASAPGKKTWSGTIEIPQGAGTRTITIPALEDLPPQAMPTTTAPAPPPAAGWSAGRIGGLALGGLGIVGLGVGAGLGGVAGSKFSDSKARCPETRCGDLVGVSLSQEAGSLADASTAMFAIGGATLAAGVVLFLVSPPAGPGAEAQRSWMTPMFGNGVAGVHAGRTW